MILSAVGLWIVTISATAATLFMQPLCQHWSGQWQRLAEVHVLSHCLAIQFFVSDGCVTFGGIQIFSCFYRSVHVPLPQTPYPSSIFFLTRKLDHLPLHMQTLGHFFSPEWMVRCSIQSSDHREEFFFTTIWFQLASLPCGADPPIKQTQDFFFSFSGSYRIPHNAIGVSWGRSFGAIMAGNKEVWLSAYALWYCLCSILEVPLPSYGGLWLDLLMGNSICWKVLVTRSLVTYGQTFFTKVRSCFSKVCNSSLHGTVLLWSLRGLHYDSFTGACHKLYIFFPTIYTSTGSVRSSAAVYDRLYDSLGQLQSSFLF